MESVKEYSLRRSGIFYGIFYRSGIWYDIFSRSGICYRIFSRSVICYRIFSRSGICHVIFSRSEKSCYVFSGSSTSTNISNMSDFSLFYLSSRTRMLLTCARNKFVQNDLLTKLRGSMRCFMGVSKFFPIIALKWSRSIRYSTEY